jgi:hypothetical protein
MALIRPIKSGRLPARRRSRAFLQALSLALSLAMAACQESGGSGDVTPQLSPTATETPLGQVLRIDGQTVLMVVVPDDEGEALYASTSAGLFVRESGQWVPTGSDHDERILLVDSRQPERIFRGAHPSCAAAGDPSVAEPIGLELSWDSGRTWLQLPQGRNVQPLVLDPDLPEVVYGSDCRLAISTTSGHTWTHYDPLPGYSITAAAMYHERLLVLAVSAGGGSRLASIDVSDPTAPEYGETLLELADATSLDVQEGRIVVAGGDMVYLSDDGGASWADSRVELPEAARSVFIPLQRQSADQVTEALRVLVVRIAPNDKHRIYAGTTAGLHLSQDDGVTWVGYDAIPPAASIFDIQFALHDADLYVTTDAGVTIVPAP